MITKQQAREYFRENLKMHRASGVPDDGIAEMFAYWMMGHIELVAKEVQEETEKRVRDACKPWRDDGLTDG